MTFRMMALAIIAGTASVLLLSAAGIYAMMSFTVSRRRREIGSVPHSVRIPGAWSRESSGGRVRSLAPASPSGSRLPRRSNGWGPVARWGTTRPSIVPERRRPDVHGRPAGGDRSGAPRPGGPADGGAAGGVRINRMHMARPSPVHPRVRERRSTGVLRSVSGVRLSHLRSDRFARSYGGQAAGPWRFQSRTRQRGAHLGRRRAQCLHRPHSLAQPLVLHLP